MNVKTAGDIRQMEIACRIAAEALVHTGKFVKAGITTDELDKIAEDYMRSKGAEPACLGYHGYPKSICTSVNSVICHGVPGNERLKEGDILNIDVTAKIHGFFGDTSTMFIVGPPTPRAVRILDCAKGAMMSGIKEAIAGQTVGDIGFAIGKFVTRAGMHAVKEIGGHGIGQKFHEEPFVPSFGKRGKGAPLLKWGTITVEPMVNETSAPISERSIPGSSITVFETSDGGWSAQYEHTVLITDGTPQILTLTS